MIRTAAAAGEAPLICLVSSFGGKAYTFNVAYGVGKAAVDRLASDMAFQLKPHGVASILDVVQRCTTLCKALDRAPALAYARPAGGAAVSISLQEWLREQFEGFVDGHVQWIVFPSPRATEPRLPTTARQLPTEPWRRLVRVA